MKTTLLTSKLLNSISLVVLSLLLVASATAQTYTTIANGSWASASTWNGGLIPPTGNIATGVVINIKHVVTYAGGNISNTGIINIQNPGGTSPRLIIPAGVNITINMLGQLNIDNGELRQYRFAGGGETGTAQNGTFTNNGGKVSIQNSFVEIAKDWANKVGSVSFNNSSLAIGGKYDLQNLGVDSLVNTSVSIGMQGNGDYTVNGALVIAYFKSARIEVASTSGKFYLQAGIMNGTIDYISLKNHVTSVYSSDKILANATIVTTGIKLNAYCIGTPSNYQPNGKFIGSQTPDCSLNYFPAKLFGGTTKSNLNFSLNPVLIAGTNLQTGAQYKYESVSPGMDALVKIDTIVGGAVINTIDDNTGSNGGFIEGFQPQITSGVGVAKSYAAFTFNFKVSGTNQDQQLDTVSLTALDIDGSSTLKEFDQIALGTGAKAAYMASSPSISLTQPIVGTFMGANVDGVDRTGVDSSARGNMFTVSNKSVSSYTLTLGMTMSKSTSSLRLFSIYMKGFDYPSPIILPVKLESFNATLNNGSNKVNLAWKTASEINVSHFVVERSLDGSSYSDAGTVLAFGNTTERKNYSLTDDISSVTTHVIYYRLRMVDMDGKIDYSNTRIIRLNNKDEKSASILVYPNPVQNELRITLPAAWQNKSAEIALFYANGQTARNVITKSASQTETINVSSLARGFYFVRANCEGQVINQKIVKN